MLLYDVFYYGKSFDRNIPLPKPDPKIKYAECKNGEKEFLVVRDGKWVAITRQELLRLEGKKE